MKRNALSVLVLTLALVSLVSCGGNNEPQKEVEGTLYEIMDKLYEAVGAEFVVLKVDVTPDNVDSYLGTSDIEYIEALSGEPMISAIPHSVVLVRLEQGADVEAAKTKIRDNADPRKWVCVGVEPDKVVVESIGHLILLVMDDNSELYKDAFLNLAE